MRDLRAIWCADVRMCAGVQMIVRGGPLRGAHDQDVIFAILVDVLRV